MMENSQDSNPYAAPSQDTPASRHRSGESLSTFEVLSISWAFTGLFPAVIMLLVTRSPFACFYAYVVTVVLNVPVLFALILLLTIIRVFWKSPIPNLLLSAVCGAASTAAVVLVIHRLLGGSLSAVNLGDPLIVIALSIGGAVSNSLFVQRYEFRNREDHD